MKPYVEQDKAGKLARQQQLAAFSDAVARGGTLSKRKLAVWATVVAVAVVIVKLIVAIVTGETRPFEF